MIGLDGPYRGNSEGSHAVAEPDAAPPTTRWPRLLRSLLELPDLGVVLRYVADHEAALVQESAILLVDAEVDTADRNGAPSANWIRSIARVLRRYRDKGFDRLEREVTALAEMNELQTAEASPDEWVRRMGQVVELYEEDPDPILYGAAIAMLSTVQEDSEAAPAALGFAQRLQLAERGSSVGALSEALEWLSGSTWEERWRYASDHIAGISSPALIAALRWLVGAVSDLSFRTHIETHLAVLSRAAELGAPRSTEALGVALDEYRLISAAAYYRQDDARTLDRLRTFGDACWELWQVNRGKWLLDEACNSFRETLALSDADDEGTVEVLTTLADILATHQEQYGEGTVDVDESIRLQRDAIRLTPAGHDDLPGRLNNLATYLIILYRRSPGNEVEVLQEAIALTRRAIDAAPATHPDQRGWLRNLSEDCQGPIVPAR